MTANTRDLPLILCANKTDKRRVVSEEEGRQFASARGLYYYETRCVVSLAALFRPQL